MDLNVANRSKKKPGLTRILYATKESLATIAEPPSTGTPAERVTIATDHTFTSGEGFREMFINRDKSVLGWEGSGDRYSKTGKSMITVFIPGDDKNVSALVKDDPDILFLIQQNPCQSGSFWQLGTKCDLASYDASATKWTSGTIDGQTVMGWEMVFFNYQDTVYYYEGAVTLPE